MTEDNPLSNVNLAAVSAPRAPAGFADGVLARFATTEAAIAVAKRRRARRAVRIAAGACAAAAAALAVVLVWPQSESTGRAVAATARHLDLAGLGVDLDAGAAIAWTVERDRLLVDQRGGATWTVPANRNLRVEVAGIGSVDATNATLHVETRMNLLDSKMIGATAATAALVTGIAVTVIHGRADVTSATNRVAVSDGHLDKRSIISAGGDAALARGEATARELQHSLHATAVELVFAGNFEWMENELLTVENAIDHVQLPPGSTIGAVSYTAGNVSVREALAPTGRFVETWPELVERFHENTAGDLAKAAKLGFARIQLAHAARRVLVIVGDGNDSDREGSRLALADLQRAARAQGIDVRAVLSPGGGKIASTIEQAGITTVDASKVDLTHALADAMGGTVPARPKAVMVVIEDDPKWLSGDVLGALADGLAQAKLPRDSRIGTVALADASRIQLPLEPATSFRASQLATLRTSRSTTVLDARPAFALAAEQLAKAPEPDKLMVVIGDLSKVDEVSLVLADMPGKYRHDGIEIRAIHYGRATVSVPEWLDPKGREILGANGPAKLKALTAAVVAAVH